MQNSMHLLKSCALAFSIAFIFPILVYQGIRSLYPIPLFTEFTEQNTEARQTERLEAQSIKSNHQLDNYYTKFFFFEFIASCAALTMGLVTRVEFLAAGWIMGGILTIISGFLYNWQHLSNSTLFLSLLIFLSLIVLGGYYDEKQK